MAKPKPARKPAADPFDGLDAVDPADDPFTGLGAPEPEPAPAPSPTPDEPVAPARTSTLEAVARGAGQSASFGGADEVAGVAAFISRLKNELEGDEPPRAAGRGIDAPVMHPLRAAIDSYGASRDVEREANVKAAADTAYDKRGMNPVLAALTPDSAFGTGELVGAAATAAAPVGAVGQAGKGLKLAQRIKAAAKPGAAIGAGTGFLSAEGGPVEQAAQTALSAAGGALIAPVAAEGARAVGKGATGATRALRARLDRMRGGPEARELQYGTPELARRAEQLADPVAGKADRALASAGMDDQAIEARARDVGSKIDELWGHGDVVKWEEDIASKGEIVKGLVGREPVPPDGLTKADAAYDAVRAEWDQLRADVGKGEGASIVARLQREAFDAYENRLKKAADSFNPEDPAAYVTERFMALDDLKRHLQKEVARGKAPFDDLLRDRMEAPLRQSLEDPSVFGAGPAALQQMRNRGWTRRLRSEGNPERGFLSENVFGEQAADPYRVARTHDPAKVLGIVRGAGKLEGEKPAKSVTEWADREAGLLEALTGHEGADPALVQRAQRARALASEIGEAMGTRGAEARAAEDLTRAAAVPPRPPGAIREALESTPTIGPIVKRLRSLPPGQRAMQMAEKERVLRANPGNEEAAAELASLAPGGTVEALGESATTGAARASSAGAGGSTGFSAATAGASSSDGAQDDPRWGRLLMSTPPGKKRDATYATLIHVDPEFRARQRQKQQEEKTP